MSTLMSPVALAALLAACAAPPPASTASSGVRPDYVPLTGSAQSVVDPNALPGQTRIPANTPVTGITDPNQRAVPQTGSAQTIRDRNAL